MVRRSSVYGSISGNWLDTSAALSFLHSAHFRIEMMRALDDFDHHRVDARDTLALLQDLKERVAAAAAPANPQTTPSLAASRPGGAENVAPIASIVVNQPEENAR
ncbi:hypothetical protein AX769_22620 (plasmid) [Frondihabitans sp. PAMC 28766]|nr:hypothetical protein AX769_22620 [Frondihabitans sp. PAMC 28766]